MVVFGGLAGDDTSPERLNDVWVLRAQPEPVGGAS